MSVSLRVRVLYVCMCAACPCALRVCARVCVRVCECLYVRASNYYCGRTSAFSRYANFRFSLVCEHIFSARLEGVLWFCNNSIFEEEKRLVL
jgi:hypothetical protein